MLIDDVKIKVKAGSGGQARDASVEHAPNPRISP